MSALFGDGGRGDGGRCPGRGGAGRVDVVAEHGVAAGDDPAGDPAAHVPEADEADLAFGVTRTPRINLGSFAIGFALGFVSHAIRTPSPSASTGKRLITSGS